MKIIALWLMFVPAIFGLCQSHLGDFKSELNQLETELWVNDKGLHLINLYKLQAAVILESDGLEPTEITERMVKKVYQPYAAFWNALINNEETFRLLVLHYNLKENPPIVEQAKNIVDLGVNQIFTEVAHRFVSLTHHQPEGSWYLIWGPGQFDMGVPSPGLCILDWSKQKATKKAIEILLPHELTHLVHRKREHDQDTGTLLDWIVTEGFGAYAAYRFWQGKYSEAECLQYTDEEWAWALQNEAMIKASAKQLLSSKSSEEINKFVADNIHLFEEGPSRLGYFLGFRMCQALVSKKNADAWTMIFELPSRIVVKESEYFK